MADGCYYLEQKSIVKLVVDGFFQNVKTFVKQQMLYKDWQQQCMLDITQQYTVTVLLYDINTRQC